MLIKRHHITSYAETTLFRHIRNKGLIKYKSSVHLTSKNEKEIPSITDIE